MQKRILWMVVGGLSFWVPAMVVAGTWPGSVDTLTLNLIPLVGTTAVGATSWAWTKKGPHWGWLLAGIYVLGPTAMLAPTVFLPTVSEVHVPYDKLWFLLFALFPPMTLWLATLNGMIFSVVLVTIALLGLQRARS